MLLGSWHAVIRGTNEVRRRAERRRRISLRRKHLKTRLRANVKLLEKLVLYVHRKRRGVLNVCSAAYRIRNTCYNINYTIHQVVFRAYPEIADVYFSSSVDPLYRPSPEVKRTIPFLCTVLEQIWNLISEANDVMCEMNCAALKLQEFIDVLTQGLVEMLDLRSNMKLAFRNREFSFTEVWCVFNVFNKLRELMPKLKIRMNQLELGMKSLTTLFETYRGEDFTQSHYQKYGGRGTAGLEML